MSLRPMRSWRARILLAITGGAVVLTGAACMPRANDLYRLRMCESGGNYGMVSGGYGGAYAVSIYYWQSAGHQGQPRRADPGIPGRGGPATAELQPAPGLPWVLGKTGLLIPSSLTPSLDLRGSRLRPTVGFAGFRPTTAATNHIVTASASCS